MAVPAVPGAGKTTIMQALIIELIKKKIKHQIITRKNNHLRLNNGFIR